MATMETRGEKIEEFHKHLKYREHILGIKVFEYEDVTPPKHLWKPKNHYLSHIPLEILHWGPPRLYWCEDFEHENQLTKNGVSHGNYANVLLSAAEHKALSVANAYECSLSCLSCDE